MQTAIIPSKGARLYTIIYPKAGAETVVLLHGGPGHPDELSWLAGVLYDKYQVVVFHQRGTGRSPCTNNDYSMRSYLADLDEVAGFVNASRFHLFGHSWGGLYAMLYAQHRQTRMLSLFLSSPLPGTNIDYMAGEKDAAQFAMRKGGAWASLRLTVQGALAKFGSDKALQRYYSMESMLLNKGFMPGSVTLLQLDQARAKAAIQTRKQAIRHAELLRLAAPGFRITITYGDQDVYKGSREITRDRYPSARFVIIPQSGHFPWLHHPEAFLPILQNHFGLAFESRHGEEIPMPSGGS